MSEQREFKLAEDLEGPQREAATKPGNLVVAAGAGSGKTTVLAARYIRLLSTGRMKGILPAGERVHARNVLVLTFTRKAAAEMYSRIYGALAAAAARRADDPELAGHLAACLADFSQAQISTFDSFAARVARSGSARFGIAPDFAVDEERAARMASDLALTFILEHREDGAMRELVASGSLEGVRDEVLAALALTRMSISSPPNFEAFHGHQAVRLEEMAAESKAKILAMRSAALEYSDIPTTPTSKAWLDALAPSPEDEADSGFLRFLDRLARLRKPASNCCDEASMFLSDCVPALKKAAIEYRDIAATRAAHPDRLVLYRLLDEFRTQWDELRRLEKTLTFRDVAQLAHDVLEADDAVLDHYRALFRYVMIDEFQDDDELQKSILFLLAGEATHSSEAERSLAEDKLFFVGDEKQSIYLFRGADVSVFRRLARDLAARSSPRPRLAGTSASSLAASAQLSLAFADSDAPPAADDAEAADAEALSLSRNFRSEPGVIAMINQIFPTVMAPLDGEEGHQDFEARFEPLESRPATPGVEPRLVYLELPRRREDAAENLRDPQVAYRDAAEAEAWEVARIVRDAVEQGSLIVADRQTGRSRKARYEDFAVLLRSTGNQVHFEKYFRLFDVPYGSENSCGLFSEAVACDMYYALRLALYPEDRNALAAFFRSPFAGLSDDALVTVLASRADRADRPGAHRPELPDASLSDRPAEAAGLALPPEIAASLRETDRRSWERGAATVRTLSEMADRVPICACLSFLWFETGYRDVLLLDPIASAFEEHFELLHSLAVGADSRHESLSAFVAELEPLVGKPDKLEIELPRELSSGVRIMTIHKSKGLEFPVVIVPQANNVGQDWGARDAWYWEEGLGPTFRPPRSVSSRSRNVFYESAKDRRAALNAAELKRLLYVALTRAESHILITATEPRGEDARGRSFRSLLAAALGLLDPPSPLARADEAKVSAARVQNLPPFGPVSALPSGALVGLIPERTDREYFFLLSGARRRGGSAGRAAFGEAASISLVRRPVRPLSSSVSSIAERYAERYAERLAPPEVLGIMADLAPPQELGPTAWGSLVHAVLEWRLGRPDAVRPNEPGLSPALESTLEYALGGDRAVKEAIARASRLAEVFLGSDLGRRALASKERYVELKVAIALRAAGGPGVSASAPRRARGSIDLAFAENGRIVIVDYKTDAQIATGTHDLQVAAYKRSASEIFGLPAEAWVFYLYGGGKAILVDEDGSAPALEAAPEPREGEIGAPSFAPGFGRPSIKNTCESVPPAYT